MDSALAARNDSGEREESGAAVRRSCTVGAAEGSGFHAIAAAGHAAPAASVVLGGIVEEKDAAGIAAPAKQAEVVVDERLGEGAGDGNQQIPWHLRNEASSRAKTSLDGLKEGVLDGPSKQAVDLRDQGARERAAARQALGGVAQGGTKGARFAAGAVRFPSPGPAIPERRSRDRIEEAGPAGPGDPVGEALNEIAEAAGTGDLGIDEVEPQAAGEENEGRRNLPARSFCHFSLPSQSKQVTICSQIRWLFTERTQAHMGEAKKISGGHVGVNVTDLERSKRFYHEVLGLEVVAESSHRGSRFAYLGTGKDLLVTLWEQSQGRYDSQRPGLHHLSFAVPTIAEVKRIEERARQRGAKLIYKGIVPHTEERDSGGIFFEDPDGVRLEVFSPEGAQEQKVVTTDGPACGFF